MKDLTILEQACLAIGSASIKPKSKDPFSARYKRARKSYLINRSAKEDMMSSFRVAMFSAAKWDHEECEKAIIVLFETYNKLKKAQKNEK